MAHDSTETAAQPGVSLLCTGSAVATGHATGALALAPGMGDKIIDVEFIRELGKKIATAGDAHLPTATTQAQSAQTAMFTAGQAGGLLVVLGFFFAAEYVEHAGAPSTARPRISAPPPSATNWQDVEQLNVVGR